MNAAPQMILRWLRAARRQGRTLVLMFDYDGTLTPIVQHPDLALLTPQVRDLLGGLAQQPGVRIGILSGRALENLRQLVAIPGIDFAGCGGLELQLGPALTQHPETAKAAAQLAALQRQLQQRIAPFPGAWIEAKPLGLTVHFRQVAADRLEALRASLHEALQPAADGLRVLPGPMAVEILPELGWSKGTAVRQMAEHAGPGPVAPCYFGDHANDASAFDAVAALGGVAVGVGPAAPASARFRLADPRAVHELLSSLLVALREGGPPDVIKPQ